MRRKRHFWEKRSSLRFDSPRRRQLNFDALMRSLARWIPERRSSPNFSAAKYNMLKRFLSTAAVVAVLGLTAILASWGFGKMRAAVSAMSESGAVLAEGDGAVKIAGGEEPPHSGGADSEAPGNTDRSERLPESEPAEGEPAKVSSTEGGSPESSPLESGSPESSPPETAGQEIVGQETAGQETAEGGEEPAEQERAAAGGAAGEEKPAAGANESSPEEAGDAAGAQQENGGAAETAVPVEETKAPSPAAIASLKVGAVVSEKELTDAGLSEFFTASEISDSLFERIYGKSYKEDCIVPRDNLRYLKVIHYGMDGKTRVGELICHKDISGALLSVFRELYDHRYPIQQMRLVDDYGADDSASEADNNTTCFNFRWVIGEGNSLSRHAYGKAIDINPLYNPYVWQDAEGVEHCSPESGREYADRSKDFPYKITENDICVQIFAKYGFSWDGNLSGERDYMHFSVAP